MLHNLIGGETVCYLL